MTKHIQTGTMMIHSSDRLRALGIESEPYCDNWQSLGGGESSRLERKIRDSGWKLFYMADELTTAVPGWGGQKGLRRGVKRLLARARLQHFNCLELTGIQRKRFLGIPYRALVAHSRHIQQGSHIESTEQRARQA